jgi:hypothetical protein
VLHVPGLADIVSSAPLALGQVLGVPVPARAGASALVGTRAAILQRVAAAARPGAAAATRALVAARLAAEAAAAAAKAGKRVHPDRYFPLVCTWYFDLDTGEVLPETFE